MNTPAKRLRHALDVRRISQHALARATGLTQGHVSSLASGRRSGEPQYSTVVKIAKHLRMLPEWWLEGVGEAPREDDAPADLLPGRVDSMRIFREAGIPEVIIERIFGDVPPEGSEAWSTLRWIQFAQLQATMMGENIAPPPASSPASRSRPRAVNSVRHLSATSKKK